MCKIDLVDDIQVLGERVGGVWVREESCLFVWAEFVLRAAPA